MSSRWNIAETHYVAKRKTEMGEKFVNNYQILHTLGQGRFGKVKLCERLANSETPSFTSTNNVEDVHTVSSDAHKTSDDTITPLIRPVFSPPKARLFAMKIFSKKMLRRLKDYCAEPAGNQLGDDDTKKGAVPMRMRAVTALDRVHEEIEIMRSLYHRNIVLLFEVIKANDSDKLYLVLEYMACGPCMVFRPDTKDFYSPVTGGTLPEELARQYLSDILLGLQYLHQRRICHRDIKPDNVLLNESGCCHITDFGCAKALNGVTKDDGVGGATHINAEPVLLSDTVGTYQFLAPECCSGEPYDPFKADIWAVGIVFYIFLYGRLPFSSGSTQELFDEIMRAEIILPGPEKSGRQLPLCPEGKDLLHRLLEKDPKQRISIADALSHPWFVQDDIDESLSV
ncbi:unnamed protein product [Peronospora belbahrii]|uniref:Protein kinase domain-containing protein n=1 Tax=Peronospora belbahrii TaxID=622444 RepID=A0AAU9L6T9_9STRA|nr:unnamed protein product [Peronospora belbahrii]